MMRETLDELLSSPILHIHKELDVDVDGNRVLDIRWFTQILRVTINCDGLILREEVYDFEDLYKIEIGWWNEDEYL